MMSHFFLGLLCGAYAGFVAGLIIFVPVGEHAGICETWRRFDAAGYLVAARSPSPPCGVTAQ